ncbi:MAG: outer membrane protein assembly factor BamD [Pseudomonadota bacterium]
MMEAFDSSGGWRRQLGIALLALTLAIGAIGCGGNKQNDLAKLADPQFLYDEAQRALSLGAFQAAVQIYEQLTVRHPFSPQARQAKLDLIYVYYRARSPEQAIDAAETFIIENPRDPNVDYAYYLRGLVFFEDDVNFVERLLSVSIAERPPNDAYRSFSYFQLLLQRFPNSAYAEDARERMVYLRNRLSAYEVYVGEFYMKRGAYVGAANRARFVLENYPDAPATQDALALLTRAYDRLGLDNLSEDTERVLAQTYGQQALQPERRGLFRLFRRGDGPEPSLEAATASEGSGDAGAATAAAQSSAAGPSSR